MILSTISKPKSKATGCLITLFPVAGERAKRLDELGGKTASIGVSLVTTCFQSCRDGQFTFPAGSAVEGCGADSFSQAFSKVYRNASREKHLGRGLFIPSPCFFHPAKYNYLKVITPIPLISRMG